MRSNVIGLDGKGYYYTLLTSVIEEKGDDLIDSRCLFCFPQSQGEIPNPENRCEEMLGKSSVLDGEIYGITLQRTRNGSVRIIPTQILGYFIANSSLVATILKSNGYRCS